MAEKANAFRRFGTMLEAYQRGEHMRIDELEEPLAELEKYKVDE